VPPAPYASFLTYFSPLPSPSNKMYCIKWYSEWHNMVSADSKIWSHLLFIWPWCHQFFAGDGQFSPQKTSVVVVIDDKANGIVNRF
jgi:hypothetical protein